MRCDDETKVYDGAIQQYKLTLLPTKTSSEFLKEKSECLEATLRTQKQKNEYMLKHVKRHLFHVKLTEWSLLQFINKKDAKNIIILATNS